MCQERERECGGKRGAERERERVCVCVCTDGRRRTCVPGAVIRERPSDAATRETSSFVSSAASALPAGAWIGLDGPAEAVEAVTAEEEEEEEDGRVEEAAEEAALAVEEFEWLSRRRFSLNVGIWDDGKAAAAFEACRGSFRRPPELGTALAST